MLSNKEDRKLQTLAKFPTSTFLDCRVQDVFSSPWLAVADLDDVADDITVTVRGVTVEDMFLRKRGIKIKRVVMWLRETPKGFILNTTNAATISKIYGDALSDWEGKAISIYIDPAVDNPNTGKKGPGLRVRQPDPPETAQAETAQAASMEQVREIDLLGRLLYPGQTDDDITPWAAKREEMILHFTGEDGVHLTDLSDLQADQLLAGFRSRYDADQAANAAPPPPIAVTLDLIPPVEEPVPDFMPPVKE